MSIERYFGQYTPCCDYCDRTLPGALSFREAVRSKRNAGWEGRRVDGVWLDLCTDCQFEEKGYDPQQVNRGL